MRRIVQLSLLGLAAGVSACSTPDLVHPTENLPYAGVRFINAVPDSAGSFGMDFRFVDLLESNAHFRITFRNGPGTAGTPAQNVSTSIQYKGAREGKRNFKIFLDDTLQSVASKVLKDTTVTLTKEHNYTAVLWGNARSATTAADAMRLGFWDEDVTAPAPGKVKLRVINATSNAIDVYTFVTTPTPPPTPTWAAVPPFSKSTYIEVDAGVYNYSAANAGGASTSLIGSTPALVGTLPTCSGVTPCPTGQQPDIQAAPGTGVAGSAVSAIVFPPANNNSKAAQFSTAGVTFVWDKRPPRTCDPYC